MYKNIKKIALCVLSIAAVVSCNKTPQVTVAASFETDKDTYEVHEVVNVTNTTVVEHSRMAICKWEWNGNVSYDMPAPDNIAFATEGVYPVTLTVTSEEGAVKGSFTKEITVIDSNVKPVADFTWSPADVVAGEEVQFTATASDSDGIASYEWTFGTTTVTEQNPVYVFKETGDIMVVLKVTDNKKGSTTVTKTVTVGRGINYLDLIWEKSYDTVTDAYVYGTSPAVNADGSRIYVHSTGYHLVAFDADGNQQWSFDTSTEGASAMSNNGNIKNQSPTPSIDKDGNVYIAVSFDEPKKCFGGVFSINQTGKKNWYTSYGRGASFRFMSPMIFGDYVATNQRNTGQVVEDGDENVFDGQNFVVLNRADGSLAQYLYCDSGPYGGIAAYERTDGWLLFAQSGGHGTRVYTPYEGLWTTPTDGSSSKGRKYNLNTGVDAQGSQMAITADGVVYSLYKNGVVQAYQMADYQVNQIATQLWSVDLDGSTSQSGLGCVLAEDGTVYVTVKEYLYALNPADGSIKWVETADGQISGVAAVDNAGGVYYNDSKTGKLIKVTPEGKRVVELSLADNVLGVDGADATMRTSPTIGPDGTIYCTGMKGGQPTLFCVKGSATAPAAGWSQLGANPQKTEALAK